MRATLSPPRAAAVHTVDVSVVIVTYNVREFLEQALESVQRASTGLRVETWVVDNDSADGSVEMVRQRFPDVHLIANEENVGFATANNQALRQMNGRYALVLNPDTILQEDTLRELVTFMDANPETGAAGCRILNPDGTFAPESRRAFPTPAVAFFRLTGLSRLFPDSPTIGRYNLTYLPQDEVCEVDALSGSCMMVRREAILEDGSGFKVQGSPSVAPVAELRTPNPELRCAAGLFDEAFFMYGEDLDWCYRIQQAGWKIQYTPSTQIVHYKGESTKKGDLRYVRLFYGAMLRFVEKHLTASGQRPAGRAASLLLALGIRAGILARAGMAAAARLASAVAAPFADGALAWTALALAAVAWSLPRGFSFDPSFYAIVLPLYTIALLLGIGGAGGYGRRAMRLRPVAIGAGVGFLAVATVTFLLPHLAFSRATVLTGFALAAVLLGIRRLLGRRRRTGPRRALVVGTGAEAERLVRLAQGRLPLEVVGFVGERTSEASVPHVGPTRQLRDLVRLNGASEVVFAADALTNTAILAGMRDLRDLPVDLKILAQHRDRIIGKANVEDLSAPLMAAERAVAPLRSRLVRRALEVPIALTGLLLHPILRPLARRAPAESRRRRLAHFTAKLPSVLAGRRALVGYDPSQTHPPKAWGLLPGVVSILDTLEAPPTTIVDAHRAYWAYARNQSAALDVDILLRALTR
ncbi:MAG: glycosyltransferase family 2 protein [Bacteroidota bacterium]